MKKIKIACKGADTIPIDELEEFQGNLKELSKENFEKLKQNILENGFSFPISIWLGPKKKKKIIDGHQRLRVLLDMKTEGYEIPGIPVDFIEAKNEQEAKRKVLAAASQFGKVTDEGFYEFLELADIRIEDVEPMIDLPDFDIETFKEGYYDEVKSEGGEEKEYDENIETDHECPQCGYKW